MSNITTEYLARIAPRLRAARESAGLSIGQTAHNFNITTAFNLSQLENGTLPSERVTDEQIDKLCEAYGIARYELDAEPLPTMSDADVFMKIKAGLMNPPTFSRWLRIDRQLTKSAQENK